MPPQPLGEAIHLDHILTLTNVTFAAPGRYAFRISVDGVAARSLALRVEQLPLAH